MSADVEYEFLVGLVMCILALEVTARRVGLPPAVAFIVGGAAIALIPALPNFTVAPALVQPLRVDACLDGDDPIAEYVRDSGYGRCLTDKKT